MRLKIKPAVSSLLICSTILLTGCSFEWETPVNKPDPYQKFNRKMFAFNDKVYTLLTPAAKAYNYVVPDSVENGIFNMFQNLYEPSRVANDLFQGEIRYAGDDSMRFLANTTLGLAGYFDVANSWFGLPMRYHQSFAVTLHKWGVYKKGDESPYIVWPIIGPGTLESVTLGVDALFNPLSYLFLVPGVGTFSAYMINYTVYGVYYANQGVSYLPAYSNLKEVSVDPYVALRNAYLQNYNYGMAKILQQKNPEAYSQDTKMDNKVLSVIGVMGLDGKSEVASSGGNIGSTPKQASVFQSSFSSVKAAEEVKNKKTGNGSVG